MDRFQQREERVYAGKREEKGRRLGLEPTRSDRLSLAFEKRE